MAKVLFIQGNYNIDNPHDRQKWMPLALVELGTLLKQNSHEVKILDRSLYPDDKKLMRLLNAFNPDVVGMTSYTSSVLKDIMRVTKIVKDNSSAMVVIGGTHATLEPKSLLSYPYIDYVVRGEGEGAILEICSLIDKKKAIKKNMLKIKNVNYNKMRPFVDLNALPIPDYELLEIKKYPIPTFYTSRGCPGRCTFCFNLGRQLRFYNTDKVIETIDSVLGKYKITEFHMADDNFALPTPRTYKICKALEKYNAIYHIFQRADYTKDELMHALKRSGCWVIQLGLESGSQRMLDYLNKNIKVEQNAKGIAQCKKHGIFVEGSFMAGLPTETPSEVKQTLNFIKKNKPDIVDIKIYKPYPSTPLGEYCFKNKLVERPKTLAEWEKYSSLRDGEPNVSNMPKDFLLNIVKNYSKTNPPVYLKKAALLIKNGHLKYVAGRVQEILKKKLGI